MKKTFKIALLAFLFFGFSDNITAQDFITNLSKKLCKCIEKNEVKNMDEVAPCFEDLIVDNLKEIKKYYNVKSINDINIEELGSKIGVQLTKDCPYILNTFKSQVSGNEEKVVKQANLQCNDLKNGDFYYLVKSSKNAKVDTTYVTISNHMFLERMKNGKTYSLLNIEWKENCTFDLIFKESNDPMKKEFSKAGDVYTYEILTNDDTSVFLKTIWRDRSYQFELFKVK
ncbi:conserved exported protein of unknown function [Tenacibaculum sp. 190130A14a]|uniref:Uncharacterized protein n=1 Tax=Tenacibaculum polynesiense TaxID=3137857 RepID=A0ABM9PDM0_9FLAO